MVLSSNFKSIESCYDFNIHINGFDLLEIQIHSLIGLNSLVTYSHIMRKEKIKKKNYEPYEVPNRSPK